MARYEGFVRVDFKCASGEDGLALRRLADERIEAHKSWSGYADDTVDSLSWLTDGWDADALVVNSELVNAGTRGKLKEFLEEVRAILPDVKYSGELHVDNVMNGSEVAHWSFTDEKMRQPRKRMAVARRKAGAGALGGEWTRRRMRHLEGALDADRLYSTGDILGILDGTEGELPEEYLTGMCYETAGRRWEVTSYGEIWHGLAQRCDVELYRAFRDRGLPLPQAESVAYSGATGTFSWMTLMRSPETSEDVERIAAYITALLDDGLEFRPSSATGLTAARSVAEDLHKMRKLFATYMPRHAELLKRLHEAGFSATPEDVGALPATGASAPDGACAAHEPPSKASSPNADRIVLPATAKGSQVHVRFGLGYGLEGIEVAEGHPSLEVIDDALVRKNELVAFPSRCKRDELIVPKKVKHVADWAFRGCEQLGRVVFQAPLKSIGLYAFSGCWSQVVMPAGAPDVSERAFQHFLGTLVYLGRDFFLMPDMIGKGFECECALAFPYIGIADVPAAFKLNAAIGYMELAARGSLEPDIEGGYAKYVKSQRKKLYGAMTRNEAVAAYMLNEAVVPAKEADALAERARAAGCDWLVQRIAEYASSPKKKGGWRPDKPAVDSYR